MVTKRATFKGGIHPAYNKHYTESLNIEDMAPVKQVVIPMAMHIGAPCSPVVNKGDKVKMGQLIGKAGGFVSANIHSSVSGVVAAVEKRLTSDGQMTMCVVIDNDFEDTPCDEIKSHDIERLTKEDIKEIIASAGLVGLGGATFPTHVKLAPPEGTKIDHVILNGAECEPYLTSDDALMKEYPEKVIGGLKIIMKLLDQQKGYIGIESNKPAAIAAIEKLADETIEVYTLDTKYPQGSEKHLITAITGREVPSGALPSAVGCVVSNTATAASVYDAVMNGKPVYERIVTVTGSGIKTPKVLKVRIGTMISEIIEFCGGLTDDAKKVILGGPMMGFAQYTTDVPATKGTSGILCLNAKDAAIQEPSNCIKCAKCVGACPMHLMPMYIAAYSQKLDYDKAAEYNALDCIECGSCAYVCPAKRPLVSAIRVAKREITAKRKKEQEAKK